MQELSAIEMCYNTHEIIDVFHEYAKTDDNDTFARSHIHGLNMDYLKRHGHSSEQSLIRVFKNWLKNKNY